jgi:alkanesulfonate monooxygenase SsuD/methylene tetrahydromethanopterin reductase-like flavin-dependent oxidoreductase (luciferase family)
MEGLDVTKSIEERVDPSLVTDYLVERFTIAGTPEECVAKIQRLKQAGVERLLLTPPDAHYNEVMEAWGRSVIPLFPNN